jgi:hypothetical protein
MVVRRIFGPKRDEATGEWRNFITYVIPKYPLADRVEENEVRGMHGREQCTRFLWESLNERDH